MFKTVFSQICLLRCFHLLGLFALKGIHPTPLLCSLCLAGGLTPVG